MKRRSALPWLTVTSSGPDYFSDAEFGARPAVLDELPPEAWAGICATFDRFADQQYFAAEFPEQCPDGKGVCGTSMAGLRGLLLSHIPKFDDWPRDRRQPDTLTAMDLVEFGWRNVQGPSVRSHHDYFDHDHLVFDQDEGRRRWRSEINLILERNGVALRLDPIGTVSRIGTPAVQTLTRSPLRSSGDDQIDDKIATALRKYSDPDVAVRLEALEALWDAFERIKTVLPGDKKQSVTSLIDSVTTDQPARDLLNDEFTALTKIGNTYRIRHHETDRHPVDPAIIDLLFARALAVATTAVLALPDGT